MTEAVPRGLGSGRFAIDSPEHAAWLQGEAHRLLQFYAAAADWSGVGFDGLSSTGQRVAGPKHLFATARMTCGFALGTLLGHPGSDQLARHGLRALREGFRDVRYGGWFAQVSADGSRMQVPSKQTYGHAFVLLAAATAADAGLPSSDLLDEAASVFSSRLYRASDGMCVDSWDRAWRRCDPYRGMNANMHACEAFLSAYSATGQPVFRQRAEAIAGRLVDFAAAARWRVPEHFSERWEPLADYNIDRRDDRFRPFGSTPGHGLEWARLLLQLRLAGGGSQERLLAAARALFDRAVKDGWKAARYGFAYTVDWDGNEVVSERLHWPLAEAIGAARFLHAATGAAEYARWYETFWQLADRHFIDRHGGSWWHELGVDGAPGSRIWSGKPDLYHALNAALFGLVSPAPSLSSQLTQSTTTTPREASDGMPHD